MPTPKTVLIALTRHGSTHAVRLAEQMPAAHILVSERFANTFETLPNEIIRYQGPLSKQVGPLFEGYDQLVFFLSVGAVVRLITPHLKSKEVDPAVLTVDDAARFTIALLSGHMGGANAFAEEVANRLGNLPVITTASDVGKTIPVDILGRELAWRVEADKETLTRSAAHVVNGEPIAFIQETGSKNWWKHDTPIPKNIHLFERLEAVKPEQFKALLWVTHREIPEDWAEQLKGKLVIYRPPRKDES